MAQPSKKPVDTTPVSIESKQSGQLPSRVVAIDPPPDGAIGIRELLDRFESFARAGELLDPPGGGSVGVRELLDRLNELAEAGHFSAGPSDKTNGTDQQ